VKFREIFRFEFVYQAHRVRTWLYFAVLFVVAYLLTKNSIDDARNGSTLANSPSVIALVTVICNMLWVLMATAVAGDSAARDARTRMHPLIYTTPISKADYLGGRFLAALVLNALILLMVPAGMLLALLLPGVEPEILGPSQSAAFVSAYILIALPTAFAATAIQFSLAALNRRSVTSYLGGVLLCVISFAAGAVANLLQLPTLGKLLDPIHLFSNGLISKAWTPIEKNTRLIGLEVPVLANDLLWVSIALGVLVFTHLRFRFGDPSAGSGRSARPDDVMHSSHSWWPVTTASVGDTPVSVARAQRTFGWITHMRQTFAIAWTSFGMIAKSATGLILLAPIAILVGLWMPELMNLGGVPLLPRTAQVITHLTSPVAGNPQFPWVLIPLLIVFYAGELIWRERDAGLSEMVDTAPVPEWVFFLGKFLGLSLILVVWMALLTAAGVLGQMRMGYFDFEIGLYLRILFGIQLIDYLLFAALVFAVHAVVNQKQVGYLVALLAYGFIAFASRLGIEHKLLVYASDPGWTYSDIRGFGTSVGPWLWFKAYWAAWALLLAAAARLLWVRGTERSVRSRLHLARRRFTRPAAGVAATAVTLILSVGGFIFYNTNVLHAYVTAADRMKRSAEYERRYGRNSGIPQPRLTATALRVEIYPERREAEIRGTYRLVNDSATVIESIHLATAAQIDTRAVSFDRRIARVLEDKELGYRIYTLEQPLRPGETLQLTFDVHFESHGFRNSGAEASVVANGTYFTNLDWLPAIGYQSNRELNAPGARRQYGLAPRPAFPSLDDAEARRIRVGGDPITFEAVVGTSGDQVAVAPGVLRRTWTEAGRRYFHYLTDVPINNEYGVFSAEYALHEEQWNPSTGSGPAVAIQIFHDPRHAENLTRMVRAVRASLSYHTERFGPYPHNYIKLIEKPTRGVGVSTEAATVEYGERFSLLNPGDGPQDLDLVFAVVAHGVAREWWGMQVAPADVEGAGLLDRSLETYSAMRVVEETLGPEHLRRYLQLMRGEYSTPSSRAAPPLLRATDSFAFSRKGPFALYAMHEYIGKELVDDALRRMVEKYRSATPPLPTSMDLYRELRAVTPDSFHYLLHDLFEKNTFWELETDRATAHQTNAGAWQVTLDVQARKVVVDEAGVETEVPMDDWVEVGVFYAGEPYLQKHRIRSGKQTVTVTVPQKPARAGIDPRHLLSELGETDDNVKAVKIGS
jgi:ABC-type transport system involved in multi-copper enzyme maturation permease subunit